MHSHYQSELYQSFRSKLIDEKLISSTDNICVTKIHPLIQNGELIHHHVITVSGTNTKYLIRTIKNKDYSNLALNSLISLNSTSNCALFPRALTQPFTIGNHLYIITSYLEGNTLESQIATLTNNELIDLSYEIEDILSIIHSQTNEEYTNPGNIHYNSFDEIMYDNICRQLNDPNNIFSKNINIDKFLNLVLSILSKASYSIPTLIHMDLKPANIIISSNGHARLIDFELTRFADLDYEWTNILIKIEHAYDERFKQNILMPIIKRNFMVLKEALLIDKYKVYLLYLAINKYLYCFYHSRKCPKAIIDLSVYLLDMLVRS